MPSVLDAMAAELLEQGLQQGSHVLVEGAAWSASGGQQQQRAGIHER